MSNLNAHLVHVQLFQCPVGVTTIGGKAAIRIRSPRTGRVLTFGDAWKPQLPDRVWGRIASAVATGRHSVSFTRDELTKIAALYPEPAVTKYIRPVCPAGMHGTALDPNRRFVA